MQSLIYSLAIIPWSWILGMLINRFVEKRNFYPRISNQVFLKRDSLNKALGVDAFKRVVRNTFFKHLNQKIKITSRPTVAELNQLRKEMIFSEMSHLFGFGLVMIVVLVLFLYYKNPVFGATLFIINVLFNLYPSLLQQKNKQRIDQCIILHFKPGGNRQ